MRLFLKSVENNNIKRLSITVLGRVQYVGFRLYAKLTANALGLSGWVSNNSCKTVDCEAQGEEKTLDEFCHELRKGPFLSRVKTLFIDEIPIISGIDTRFLIIHSHYVRNELSPSFGKALVKTVDFSG